MRVLVAGAGAVGSWLGAALAAGGAEVALVARGARYQALAGGTVRRRIDGRDERWPITAFDSIGRAAEAGPFDVTFVTVKSYQTLGLAAELVEAGVRGPWMSFQNGVGCEAVLGAAAAEREVPKGAALARIPRAASPSDAVWAATITTAVHIPEPGTVERRGATAGGVGIGIASGSDPDPDHGFRAGGARSVEHVGALLSAGGLAVRRYPDPDAMKWSKLLLNMLGAATCALVRAAPSEILARRDIFAVEHRAWREALSVMRALGIRAVALPGYRVDAFAAAAALPGPVLGALVRRRLAEARGDRLPGPAEDLVAGRAESEIHAMHGAIAGIGAEIGVATPVCARLCELVDGIARGRIPAARFAGRPAALAEAVLRPSVRALRAGR